MRSYGSMRATQNEAAQKISQDLRDEENGVKMEKDEWQKGS